MLSLKFDSGLDTKRPAGGRLINKHSGEILQAPAFVSKLFGGWREKKKTDVTDTTSQ